MKNEKTIKKEKNKKLLNAAESMAEILIRQIDLQKINKKK